uniref:SWIRM domain-containing protein n=2 Tax=Caenorhabditis japonica TaxID=281687 RepID=A0A8R1HZ44_CAEJA
MTTEMDEDERREEQVATAPDQPTSTGKQEEEEENWTRETASEKFNGVENDEENGEEEAANANEQEEKPVKMERVKRACAIATAAAAALVESKKARKSLNFDDKCVLKLGNCKSSLLAGGHRLSATESACASCFMTTFRGKEYENGFLAWKQKAMDGQTQVRSDQFVKRFVNSQFLPYYKKCHRCGKYSQFGTTESLSARDFANFQCEMGCDSNVEAPEVEKVRKDVSWYANDIGHPPLLQNNVAYDLLVDHYVTRTTGMDATCQDRADLIDDGGVAFRDTKKIMNMFYVPFTDVIANIVHPEFMETDEKFAFPRFADDPQSIYYLQVRNTIIAMWLKHPFVELTSRMVQSQIIVRGHARIFLIEHVIQPILEFLTIKGIVNYGAFDFRITPVKTNAKIAIIGAGISGLSTARHLKHLGIDAVILEAKDRHGGRMNDDKNLGVAVGKGAQIIVGNINNPITLLCEQIGISYRNSNFFCPLIDETGKCLTVEMRELDDQVDLHYNNVLDAIRNKYQSDKNFPDMTLEEMFSKMSSGLLSASELDDLYTPEFEKLLDFHLGNLEFSCGTKVAALSAKEYDHNEKFGNFAGEHAVITDGAQSIVDFLAENLDIRLNSAVKTIDWHEKKVLIRFEDDRPPMEFDKVVITTSLSVLKRNPQMFRPPLPSDKRTAIDNLGAGLIEKIAVKFDRRFWQSVDSQGTLTEYFGKVSDVQTDRSMFNIFYDFSGKSYTGEDVYVLMSYVTAEHVEMVNKLTDNQVAEKFVDVLRKMFPTAVIHPMGHMVSHWGADPYIGMSYTFVPFGTNGDATYNKLKETVDEKLYFAGEHTIAAEPQTMAGAYISGLREASKIVMSLKRSVPELKDN